METLLIILILLLASTLVGIIILLKNMKNPSANIGDAISKNVSEKLFIQLQSANEQLINLANEKLGAESKNIGTDLQNKKEAIESLMKEIKTDLKEVEQRRIGSFESLQRGLKEHQEITKQLSATTDSLKRVLSNNRLRGQFGEQVAENLLKMAGFVKGVNFQFNKTQDTSRSRPDFTIFLPDRTKINVDAKFPYDNLQRSIESENEESKQEYFKKFKQDVKDKIKQVSSRDYINPEEQTVDFVILFVPNEMIFSYIYDQMNEIWSDAMNAKVILAGPFSFTAILRMVNQSYDNFKYQNNVQKIITYIKQFEQEWDKYTVEFQKIGPRIKSLENQYEQVNTTRANKLMKTVNQIKIEEGESKEKSLLDETSN